MITIIKPIVLPHGLYVEYLPDAESLHADAKNITEQVALLAMIVQGKGPDDEVLLSLMCRIMVIGFYSILHDCHEPVIIQTVINETLDTTFDGLPHHVWELAMRKIVTPEFAEGLKEFLEA